MVETRKPHTIILDIKLQIPCSLWLALVIPQRTMCEAVLITFLRLHNFYVMSRKRLPHGDKRIEACCSVIFDSSNQLQREKFIQCIHYSTDIQISNSLGLYVCLSYGSNTHLLKSCYTTALDKCVLQNPHSSAPSISSREQKYIKKHFHIILKRIPLSDDLVMRSICLSMKNWKCGINIKIPPKSTVGNVTKDSVSRSPYIRSPCLQRQTVVPQRKPKVESGEVQQENTTVQLCLKKAKRLKNRKSQHQNTHIPGSLKTHRLSTRTRHISMTTQGLNVLIKQAKKKVSHHKSFLSKIEDDLGYNELLTLLQWRRPRFDQNVIVYTGRKQASPNPRMQSSASSERHMQSSVSKEHERHRGLAISGITTPESNPYSIRDLMHREILRLSSFSFPFYPLDKIVWTTMLATDGFYFVEGYIVKCFSCGSEHNIINVPSRPIHNQYCQRNEINQPLSAGTEGITLEQLKCFYQKYQYSAVPRNVSPSLDERSSTFYSSGYGSSGMSYRSHSLPDCKLQSSEISMNNNYGANTLSTDYPEGSFRSTSPNYVFSRCRSLPDDLNTFRQVVTEESREDRGISKSYILTSASSSGPSTLHVHELTGRGSQDSVEETDEGAVGGRTRETARLDLRLASYPQFANAYSRRLTFISVWSPDHPQTPENLVAGGFFYAGYDDCVRCFYCGLGLKYFRSTDIPEYQHARFRPQCVYNLMYKGQAYIDRVEQETRNERGQVNSPTEARPGNAQQDTRHSQLLSSSVAQSAIQAGWGQRQVAEAVEKLVTDLGEQFLILDMLLDVLNNLNPEGPALESVFQGEMDLASSSTTDGEEVITQVDSINPAELANLRKKQ